MTMGQKIRPALALAIAAAVSLAASAGAHVHIDRSFGTGGIAQTPLPTAYESELFSEVAAAPDGGALTRLGWFSSGEVVTWSPAGTIAGEETSEKSVVLQPPEATAADGARLVGVRGTEERTSTVRRYAPDGSPDAAFGSEGFGATLPFYVEGVAALPSGKVLAVGAGVYYRGDTKRPPVDQVFVARLDPDGRLDPTFGKEGVAKLHGEDEVTDQTALHVQGRAGEGAEIATATALVALDGSGHLDKGFGDGGKVALAGDVVGAGSGPGETLLVAGTRRPAGAPETGRATSVFYAARYTAGGKPDPAYAGASGVAVLAPAGVAQADVARVEADGSLLVGGLFAPQVPGCPLKYACGQIPAVARFTAGGAPDDSFGNGGLVSLPTLAVPVQAASYHRGVAAITRRPAGGIFVSGEAEHGPFVAAIAADGSAVEGFGAGGVAVRKTLRPPYSAPLDAGVDGAGNIYVAIETDSGGSAVNPTAVVRYSPYGVLDRGYGEEGRAFVPSGAQDLAVAPDGSVYLTSASESSLTKLTPAGVLGPSFGDHGSVVISAREPHFTAWTLAREGNGDLVVGGTVGSVFAPRPTVYRFLPDGKLDRSFGKHGRTVLRLGRHRRWDPRTVSLDGKGRIVLAGQTERRHHCCDQHGMLVRLTSKGRLDRSFGRHGAVVVGGIGHGIESLAMRGGHILAAAPLAYGYGGGDVVYSFDSSGRPDRRFGHGGLAYSRLHLTHKEETGEESVAIFSTPHRILLIRTGRHTPLASFSPRGRLQPGVVRGLKGLAPGRPYPNEALGPIGTVAGESLIVAWTGPPPKPTRRGYEGEMRLQRLQLR
jgi:uncharacterized delta-60 repeat protein